jgi:dCTP deaminase
MMLKSDRIADLLDNPSGKSDPLIITPQPDIASLRTSGSASVDLRLGTWFLTLRQSRIGELDISMKGDDVIGENKLTRRYYVPFGKKFVLHPRYFVLGATMEWIRLPKDLGGYVVGKSTWGRRGLVIATAVGVHPGFSGCLTLEITNLGELPVALRPGMQICQLFLHRVDGDSDALDDSPAVGFRRPTLGVPVLDETAQRLGPVSHE